MNHAALAQVPATLETPAVSAKGTEAPTSTRGREKELPTPRAGREAAAP